MTTCILADDELHLTRYLTDQLKIAWPELDILATAANGVEAERLIAQHQPDIAFLDIQMPGLTGLEVAQAVEGATHIVFVTAYDEYAIQAFDDGAIDYLLKPVTSERLAKCVLRLRQRVAPTPAQVAGAPAGGSDLAAALERLLRSGGLAPILNAAQTMPAARQYLSYVRAHERVAQSEHVLQIDVDDVLYFESADKYTCVVLSTGEKLLRTSLAELEAELNPTQFKRIHRGTIVNLAHVHSTRRDETGRMFVKLKQHPRELTVSRAYHAVFGRM